MKEQGQTPCLPDKDETISIFGKIDIYKLLMQNSYETMMCYFVKISPKDGYIGRKC